MIQFPAPQSSSYFDSATTLRCRKLSHVQSANLLTQLLISEMFFIFQRKCSTQELTIEELQSQQHIKVLQELGYKKEPQEEEEEINFTS